MRCLIPLVSKQLCVLLGEGLINFKILFLQKLKLSKFQTDFSRLSHSIITEEKKEFLKNLCLKKKEVCFSTTLCYKRWFAEVVTHKGNAEIGF